MEKTIREIKDKEPEVEIPEFWDEEIEFPRPRKEKKIDLRRYPIVKNYEVFPEGNFYIETTKGIETESEWKQFIKFIKSLSRWK